MKAQVSKELAADVAAWLAAGNEITKLQPGSARGIKAKKVQPINN